MTDLYKLHKEKRIDHNRAPLSREVLVEKFEKMNLALFKPKKTSAMCVLLMRHVTLRLRRGWSTDRRKTRQGMRKTVKKSIRFNIGHQPGWGSEDSCCVHGQFCCDLVCKHPHSITSKTCACITLLCITWLPKEPCLMSGMKVKVSCLIVNLLLASLTIWRKVQNMMYSHCFLMGADIKIIIIIIIISFIKRKNYRIKLFLCTLQLRKILLHKRLMFD